MELLRGERDVVRIGHRGAAALAPENTLAAIEVAAAHGVDAVELDVRRGADGEVVLAHGPGVPRGAPDFEDALDLASALGLAVQVDVKAGGVEESVAAALRRHAYVERSFVSSFSPAVLRAFASLEPGLARALTYPEDRRGVSGHRLLAPAVRPLLAAMRAALPSRLPRWLRAVEARAATLNAGVVSARAVELCHRLEVAVYVWTVNDAALARTLVESGVDGIITDDPRILAPGIHTSR